MLTRWSLAIRTLAVWLPALSGCSSPMEKGMQAFEQKDYATSLREWEPLARKGDARAQFLVGTLYYHGQGVPQDHGEAARWLRLAGDQGITPAQYMLGG